MQTDDFEPSCGKNRAGLPFPQVGGVSSGLEP